MESLKLIIVDDEKRVRTSLRHLITMYYPSAEIVAEAGDVEEAYSEIIKHSPDVVLLDIQLSGRTGFDLLRKLVPVNFKLIFITAFDQYAIQAFKFSAIDYLLKPVNPEDLVSALHKASTLIDKKDLSLKIDTLLNNMGSNSLEPKKILLKTQETVYLVNLSDIIRCEADRNYTRFYLADNKTILVSGSLIEYDDTLTPSGFFRAHHSHLINLNFISKIEKHKMQVVLKDNSVIPLANRKKDALIQFLEKSVK
ncbi:MAG: response regulator transcription factor [Bacteroidetes bacterium]|nr:response regulator transcription factor [Bacteroidota bacterium]MBK7572902.1 response regulator transcription factor [Bacteroidota bacterium]